LAHSFIMLKKPPASIVTLILGLAIVFAPKADSAPTVSHFLLAQSPVVAPSFPLPTAVAPGTTVKIDGSSSLEVTNQNLKQLFETQFPGTTVQLNVQGTDAALKAVLEGQIDVAAIGRALTPEEQAQGLVASPIRREKIAIIIGPDNPFTGNLTFEQFAKIFRGEITDWSEVGGPAGPIRVVDRPELSDTRQAFKPYPVFKIAPFATGATAKPVSQDRTVEVINALGKDGIGYAIANQVLGQKSVKIIPMHKTLPDDPRYPYSQPLAYVYQGPTASPVVQSFLGLVGAPAGQAAIQAAKAAEVAAVAAGTGAAAPLNAPVAVSPVPNPPPALAPGPGAAPNDTGLPPWLWLLPLLFGGIVLWWLLGRRRPEPDLAPNGDITIPPTPMTPVVPTPAAAPPPGADAVASSGSATPLSQVAEPTGAPLASPVDLAAPDPAMFDLPHPAAGSGAVAPDRLPGVLAGGAVGAGAIAQAAAAPIAASLDSITTAATPAATAPQIVDLTEGGITAAPGVNVAGAALAAGWGAAAWAARSENPSPDLAADPAQTAVVAAKVDDGLPRSALDLADVDSGLQDLPDGYGDSRIVLLPRDPQAAYAYWDVPNDHKAELRRQGGQQLALRLCDVTDIEINQQPPHSMQQYDCDEMARDWHLPIPVSDRDYVAEIGYLTAAGGWLLLARSQPVRIPPVYPSDWFEEKFVAIDWHQNLRGQTVATLTPPSPLVSPLDGDTLHEQLFTLAGGVAARRVVGSLFGSMQQVPVESVSSFGFPSGLGLGPTPSGLNMSGISRSGIGFAASMPPLRARKFWLVADAELIIYGATEPDATVTIAGHPVTLNPDGTFRFQMPFPDGLRDFPIWATAVDGEQNRAIQMKFTRATPERRTNTKDEATDELF
jgi:ABC-type phosphate transport system substrate-binding protein